MSDSGSDLDESEEIRGDYIDNAIDDTALANAARRSHLPFDRPTEHELAFFPELWESKSAIEVFLLIRNTTLASWLVSRNKECTAADVRENLFPPFNSDIDLIQNVVHYLTRHGIINYGRYTRVTKIAKHLVRDERSVIVIGAGAAGIAAATQLTSFGFDVIIIEGRPRVGGRAQNLYSKDGQLMETGADTLRMIDSSPLTTILAQLKMEQHDAFEASTIFVDGKMIDQKKDELIGGLYVTARGSLNWQAHKHDHRDATGAYISRQQAYENLFSMLERSTQMRYYNYAKSLRDIAKGRDRYFQQMKKLRAIAVDAEQRLQRLPHDADPILRRSIKMDIVDALTKFDAASSAFETLENSLAHLEKHKQFKQFMHPKDFRNFNFLLGFEEYLHGAPLEKVQFSCDAHHNKANGACTRLTKGIAQMLIEVAQKRDLDIRLKHRVLDINYTSDDKVKLTVETVHGVKEMSAAFVVSTLPIGVLKKTIAEDPRAPTFNPALSSEKVEAIRAMGSGIVNKCILTFDRAFWANRKLYQFVSISPTIKTRGSMLLWSAVPGTKVITTYIVGEAALHNLPDDVVVHNALCALQKIFGHHCPKSAKTAYVTRWQNDEFAFGSGSYMGLNTELHHFDELMKPLATGDGKGRVYFAGEHTSSSYTSTLQGAWMSGCRAAADLANDHIGVGFVDLSSLYAGEPGDNEPFIPDRDGEMPNENEMTGAAAGSANLGKV